MAVYSSIGNTLRLEGLSAYAGKRVKRQLRSSLYELSPLVGFLMGKAMTTDAFRPGAFTLLGQNVESVKREKHQGESEIKVRVQTGKAAGGKWMDYRDTSPEAEHAQVDDVSSATFKYCHFKQPIKVWKDDIDLSKGSIGIADPMNDSTDMAMQQMIEQLAVVLYTGTPTSQSAQKWDMPHGLTDALAASGTYGNLAKSATSSWYSNAVTTSQVANVDIVDTANITQGAATYGTGVTLVLAGKANYLKIKQDALAKGGLITYDGMPNAAEVGIKKEAVQYGMATITLDPHIASQTSNTSVPSAARDDISGYVFCLNPKDWYMSMLRGFEVTKFTDQSLQTGGDEALAAFIETYFCFWCENPRGSVMFTTVA